MCCSAAARSQSVEKADPGFVLLDVLLYRPVGLAVTIIGAGAFIGLSPLTALASIPEPHDAFAKVGSILILAPAAYTFIRPVGDRDFPYHAPGHTHKPVAAHSSTVVPKQRTIAPAVTDVQTPQSYPDSAKGF